MSLEFVPLPMSLPLFAAGDVYYAPGRLAVVPSGSREAFRRGLLGEAPAAAQPEAAALRQAAADAVRQYEALATRPYRPVCLTVYLHNDCRLACVYCFSRPARGGGGRVALEDVAAAARRVAAHCRAQGQPLTYVCHGGGEPLLDRRLAEAALATVEAVADAHGLSLFRYVASSGVLPAATARWAAERFDRLGLSCDGPPDIHDRQRRAAGGATSAAVARTAAIWRAAGRPFDARVTVTPDSCDRLAEIAEYLCRVIGPRDIRCEPAYGPLVGWEARPELVARFIAGHRAAANVAAAHGVGWRLSLARPDDIHTAHCHVFRDVLHLLPEGVLTNCFLDCDGGQAGRRGMSLGRAGDSDEVATDAAGPLRHRLSRLPAVCAACPNGYHCVRACPDACLAASDPATDSFRCRLSRGLLLARLEREAERLRAGATFRAGRAVGQAITEV